MVEPQNITILVRSVFIESNKYYAQVSLDVFMNYLLCIILMLEYDRIDMSEGIDVNKTNKSSSCIICNYY